MFYWQSVSVPIRRKAPSLDGLRLGAGRAKRLTGFVSLRMALAQPGPEVALPSDSIRGNLGPLGVSLRFHPSVGAKYVHRPIS